MIRSMLALAAPLVNALVAVEASISALRRDRRYSLADTITSLLVGLGSILADSVWIVVALGAYTAVHERTPMRLPTHEPWVWVVLFFAEDLCFYAFHRASHASGVLWAAHSVHHSSRHFNLSTATRQAWTSGLLSWIFWTPLALLGFHPLMILTMQGLSLLYQFGLHTEYVNRLGPLEWVLNTPRHHRVHHGREPGQAASNLGGVLIVWDRLFGTFREEPGAVAYGLRGRPACGNPFVVALGGYVDLWRAGRRAGSLRERVRRLLGGGPDLDRSPSRSRRRIPVAAAGLLILVPVAAGFAFVGEEYLRRAIVREGARRLGLVQGLTGTIVEHGVIPGEPDAVATSRVAFRADPFALEVLRVGPAAWSGDRLGIGGGTILFHEASTNLAVRFEGLDASSFSWDPALLRARLDRELDAYRFSLEGRGERFGRAVESWNASPRPGTLLPRARATLDRETGWLLGLELAPLAPGAPPYSFQYEEFDPGSTPDVDIRPPATATVIEWNLADPALPPGRARSDIDFEPLLPDAAWGSPRLVRSRGRWPPALAVVLEDGIYLTILTETRDRGLLSPHRPGVDVDLDGVPARLTFAGNVSFLSFVKQGVEVRLATNRALPDALELAMQLDPG